jgi:hypothetical protein
VTAVTYFDMLQLYLLPQLEDQPNVAFQQDGAPPHWARIAREFHDMHFPGRWVGRGGPIPRPPRPSDLRPLIPSCDDTVRDRLCALVVRGPDYRGPGFDSLALPDFLRSSGSGTGSTQPREDN